MGIRVHVPRRVELPRRGALKPRPVVQAQLLRLSCREGSVSSLCPLPFLLFPCGARSAPPPMSEDRDEPPLLPAGKRGQGEHLHRAGEPAAVILAGDILRWVIPKVAKLPRNLRYGLGARIEAALTDVLEELVAAQYARGPVRKARLVSRSGRLGPGCRSPSRMTPALVQALQLGKSVACRSESSPSKTRSSSPPSALRHARFVILLRLLPRGAAAWRFERSGTDSSRRSPL